MRFQLALGLRRRGAAIEIVQRLRVAGKVIQFTLPGWAIDQAVRLGAHGDHPANTIGVLLLLLTFGVVDVAGVTGKLVTIGAAFKTVGFMARITTFGEGNPLGIAGCARQLLAIALGKMGVLRRDAGLFQRRRHQVKEFDRLVDHMPRLAPRRADNQRHTGDHLFPGARPLFDQTVVTGVVAMIGGKGHGGVVGQPAILQRVEQLAQ